MKIPWSFILALFLGFILGIVLFIGFLYTELGIPTHQSQWIYDITQKKERIANAIPGPKLLITAGSSTLFSINAALIEQETGFPAVNMGTHAGLCIDYRLYRIKKVAKPGDVVLMALEYEYYSNGAETHEQWNDDYVLSRDPDYFRQVPLTEKIAMATRVGFNRLQKGWDDHFHPDNHPRPPGPPPYSAYSPITPGIDCLDDHGDQVFNPVAARPPHKPIAFDRRIPMLVNGQPDADTDGFHVIADFIAWAHANHITVLATFPTCIKQPEYDLPKEHETIKTITDFYQAHGVPVIGTADEVMLPPDQFYDTMYHLTHEAALQRTERLIPELKPYLPAKK